MKLIYCPLCTDVVRLKKQKKFCECKKSWGKYEEDLLTSEIGGKAIVIGFSNNSFMNALKNKKTTEFDAFVIKEIKK